ncbi:MAG TPA: GNAT family N-acetyltransferase [Candidatus Ruania gallistercoris]|uniref:GNAT family N-acetyltransferase n=1 Tax=Candidatus Ruania gallistercoris TaxID=2838746 RepID=A0A9D2EI69_9MICO|nr:GNAT family N-acetyltransferase [Candidatus Ruania gallistercoris]
MTASGIAARTATHAELEVVTGLCLEAFADEAVAAWIIPDPAERQRNLREMFSASLETVIEAGAMILAIDPGGTPIATSIWLPRDAASEPTEPEPSVVEDGSQARRMRAVETATQARRPQGSYLHLSSMATLPDHRGRGAGSAMLHAGLERSRTLDLPVYLEASTSDNRRLYARSGFHDLGEPIHLPEGGPSLQPMWAETAR